MTDFFSSTRPTLSRLMLNLIVAAYILAVPNSLFWAEFQGVFATMPLAKPAFALAILALTMFILQLFTLPWLHRPALAFVIVVAAVSDHFQREYGVRIDREMIQNAMLTTANESKHLFTVTYLRDLLLMGVLPAALVFWPRLKPLGWRQWLWRYPVAIGVCFALVAGLLMTDFKAYAAALREHRTMMAVYQPGASLSAALRYGKMQFITAQTVTAPYGRDAEKGPRLAAAAKPVLTVFFVGETARAQNWGLNGYARDTTPELAKRSDIINFTDTWSCGTSTAVSLPCMFSALPQEDYSQVKGRAQENLMDVLAHAGVKTDWVDNNTGDLGVAARTGSRRIDATIDPSACTMGECTDLAMLTVLRDTLAGMTEDTVLVLHMIGSHGPAYFLRYPPEEAAFKPDCRSAAFADCTPEEITNSYDNSIRYSDKILAQSIAMLEGQDRVIPALMFVSDHGESLGEGGLYLHAAPMFMAPETQRKVPFVLWLPPVWQAAMGVDGACIKAKSALAQSHDIVFHTILGMMDIQTKVREAGLDLTAGCRVEG